MPRRLGAMVPWVAAVVVGSCGGLHPEQVSRSGAGAYEAALAPAGSGFAVAWHDERDGNAEIYLRLVDASGQPASAEFRLTDTPEASYEPSIDALGDDLVVAWYERDAEQGTSARLGVWSATGARRWQHEFAPSSRNPVVRVAGDQLFCAWVQAEGSGGAESVWGGWWSAGGDPVSPPVRLAPASATTWNLNVAIDASRRPWVVFDDEESTRASELVLVRMEDEGPRVVRLTADDGAPSKYPDVAMSRDGQVAITWYDERDGNQEVYALVGGPQVLDGEIDGRARRISRSAGDSIGAYLAWNEDRVGLAWSDEQDGQHEVQLLRLDATGEPLGEPRRLTENPTWSLVPAIRPWAGGFALAWNEYAPASAQIHDGTSEVVFLAVP